MLPKRGNHGPFCSPNAFQSDFDNTLRKSSLREHPVFSVQFYSFTRLAPVPSRKMIIWSRNYPFVIVLRWKENGASFFICVFYLLWIHKTQGETKLDGRSCIFLTYEWLEFPYLEPQRSRKSCSNCPFFHIFSRSGNLRLLNWKNKAQKNKRA